MCSDLYTYSEPVHPVCFETDINTKLEIYRLCQKECSEIPSGSSERQRRRTSEATPTKPTEINYKPEAALASDGVILTILPRSTRPPSPSPTVRATTRGPTMSPSVTDTSAPSWLATSMPTIAPVKVSAPTPTPSRLPPDDSQITSTSEPSRSVTIAPSSSARTSSPDVSVTGSPISTATLAPTKLATLTPVQSSQGTLDPTALPTLKNTFVPTVRPTLSPSDSPTVMPTTKTPTVAPSAKPSVTLTLEPTLSPSAEPTFSLTFEPTGKPSAKPTPKPSAKPTPKPSAKPTHKPSAKPSFLPTLVVKTTMPSRRENDDNSTPIAPPSNAPISEKESLSPSFAGTTAENTETPTALQNSSEQPELEDLVEDGIQGNNTVRESSNSRSIELHDLGIILQNATELTNSYLESFASTLEEWYTTFYQTELVCSSFDVVSVDIQVTQQRITVDEDGIQEIGLKYNQTITFNEISSTNNPSECSESLDVGNSTDMEIIEYPFQSSDANMKLTSALRDNFPGLSSIIYPIASPNFWIDEKKASADVDSQSRSALQVAIPVTAFFLFAASLNMFFMWREGRKKRHETE